MPVSLSPGAIDPSHSPSLGNGPQGHPKDPQMTTHTAPITAQAGPEFSQSFTARAAHVAALKAMPWDYEWLPAHSAEWRKGRAKHRELKALRAAIDARGTVWNMYAPPLHQFKHY